MVRINRTGCNGVEMPDTVVNRNFFLGVVFYYTPTLCGVLERKLPMSETVTLAQLNQILIEELSKITFPDMTTIKTYLCDKQSLSVWFEDIGNYVLPVIASHGLYA